QALPEIISNFKKQGYRFVTIPELLEMQDADQKLLGHKK
ncbi:MAG: polysaccharide deacetylase family protein, partial [Nostoc sp.]